ncbi:MAG: transporter substrate-binding domain-containing protein [Thiolinea sp.]
MFRYFISLLLISLVINVNPAHAGDEIIKVRVSNFPPYYFYDQASEQWLGMVIEIMNAIEEKSGLEFEYTELPRKRAFNDIKTGDLDIMLNITRTPEREEFLDFIGVCAFERMSLVIKKKMRILKLKAWMI